MEKEEIIDFGAPAFVTYNNIAYEAAPLNLSHVQAALESAAMCMMYSDDTDGTAFLEALGERGAHAILKIERNRQILLTEKPTRWQRFLWQWFNIVPPQALILPLNARGYFSRAWVSPERDKFVFGRLDA